MKREQSFYNFSKYVIHNEVMYINFGKYKGTAMDDLPTSYLEWLLDPVLSDGTVYKVPTEIQHEAESILEDRDDWWGYY